MKLPDPQAFLGPQDHLETLDKSGTPPRTRLKDAQSAHQIYLAFRKADSDSSFNRVRTAEMFDGAPPLNSAQLKSMGQGHRNNLNFGEGKARKVAAVASYNDLTDSVPSLVHLRMNPNRGTEQELFEKQEIIAEEYTRMQKSWNGFEFNTQLLAGHYIGNGVGVAYYPHEIDWRWEVTGLGDFLVPRGSKAHEDAVDVAIATRNYTVTDLYGYIENEDIASNSGWNVKAVKARIMSAYPASSNANNPTLRWEQVQEDVKNNDLYVSFGRELVVVTNHIWTKEFSGRVSHYIVDEKGVEKDFLFQSANRFSKMGNCFIIFPYGVGNGSIHSIRGMGYDIFNHVQASNKLRNAVLDGAFLSSAVIVDVEDSDDYSNMGLISFGPIVVKPPGMKISETQFSSKVAELMPVINDLSMQMSNNTGSYQGQAAEPDNGGNQEKTRFQVKSENAGQAVLSSGAMNLFYQPWGRLHRETFRRIQNPDYREDHPGGPEVFEFRKRCLRRGVTFDDIRAVEDVMPTRAIGNGSAQSRMMAMEEMMEMMGALDEVGRNNLLREKTAGLVGWDQVDRFVPKIKTSAGRPVLDAKLAELENADFSLGQNINPAMGENHTVHAGIHLQMLSQLMQTAQQQWEAMQQQGEAGSSGSGGSGGGQQPQDQSGQDQGGGSGGGGMQQVALVFSIAIPHTAYHIEAMAIDKTRADTYKEYKATLNTIHNFAMHLHQQLLEQMDGQKRDMALQAAQQQQGGGQVTPELQMAMQKHALHMQQLQQMGQLKMSLRAEDARQKMSLRDLSTAQKLREAQQLATRPVTSPSN